MTYMVILFFLNNLQLKCDIVLKSRITMLDCGMTSDQM